MKKIIFIIFIFILTLFFTGWVNRSLAEDISTSSAFPATITFPIVELGNCPDKAACKDYCDQPLSRDACQNYAIVHKLITPQPTPLIDTAKAIQLISEAKKLIGCDSYDTCKAFCDIDSNHEECLDFSQKNNDLINNYDEIIPNPIESFSTLLFQITQQELGCNSENSCKTFCSDEQNYQKCTQFAQKHLSLRSTPPPLNSPTNTPPLTVPTAINSYPLSPAPLKPGVQSLPTKPINICTNDNSCKFRTPGSGFRCDAEKKYNESGSNWCECSTDCDIVVK